MVPVFAAIGLLAGFVLGTNVGPQPTLKASAWTGLVLSGIGAYAWRLAPFAVLTDLLGHYYAVLMLGVFYLSAGILIGLLYRQVKRMPDV